MSVGEVAEAPHQESTQEADQVTHLADAGTEFTEKTEENKQSVTAQASASVSSDEPDFNPFSLLQEGAQLWNKKIDAVVVSITPPDDHKPIKDELVKIEESPRYDPYGLPLPPTFNAKDPSNPASVDAASHANMQMARSEIGAFTGAVGAVPKAFFNIVGGTAGLIKGVGDYTVGLALDSAAKNKAAVEQKFNNVNAVIKAAGDFLQNPLKPVQDFANSQRADIAAGRFSTAGIKGGKAISNSGMAAIGTLQSAASLPKLMKSLDNQFGDAAALRRASQEARIPIDDLTPSQKGAKGKPAAGFIEDAETPLDPTIDPDFFTKDKLRDPKELASVRRLNEAFEKRMQGDLNGLIKASHDLDDMVYQIDFPVEAQHIDALSRIINPLTPSNIARVRADAAKYFQSIEEYLNKIPIDETNPFHFSVIDKQNRITNFKEVVEEKLKKLDQYQGRN